MISTAFGTTIVEATQFVTDEAWPTFSAFARPGGVNKFFVYNQPRDADVRLSMCP